MTRTIAQSPQLKCNLTGMCDLECFDQRCNPSAVDIGRRSQVDRECRQPLPTYRQELIAQGWRGVDRARPVTETTAPPSLLVTLMVKSRFEVDSIVFKASLRSALPLLNARDAPIGKPLKTLRPPPRAESIASRIREFVKVAEEVTVWPSPRQHLVRTWKARKESRNQDLRLIEAVLGLKCRFTVYLTAGQYVGRFSRAMENAKP